MKKTTILSALQMTQSDTLSLSAECEKIKGIDLTIGFCKLDTPPPVLRGAKDAIFKGYNYYSRYRGIPQLRKSIAAKLAGYNKIQADPETQIIVTCGVTGALYSAACALLKPGDEIILFEPFYGFHLHTFLSIGVKPVFLKTAPPDWAIDMIHLEHIITKKTKAILICTPSNPSGKVFSKKELKEIAEICNKHDLIVFTDEIYEYFLYDSLEHTSPGSLPELRDRTVTISGYSKIYSITGWRIGYCACKEEWASAIGAFHNLFYVCAPAPFQFGVAEGIDKLPASYYENMGKSFGIKRNRICGALQDAGLTPYIPHGSYYVVADAKIIKGRGSREKAMELLRTTGLATVPGRAFYHDKSGENLLRISFAKKDEELDKACERLKLLRK